MNFIGQNTPRVDAHDKALGIAKYVDDIVLPGMWHGAVVRAKAPAGRITSVDFDPSFDWSKVVVATADDIPGKNCVAMIEKDMPLLATAEFRYVGEGICLIAAPTREMALEARKRVEVKFEAIDPVLTMEESLSKKRVLYGDDNLFASYDIVKGDVDAGFKNSDLIIEGDYSVGHQEHLYIEPQSVIADFRKDGVMEIIGSLQCPYYVHDAMKYLFGWDDARIAVRQAVVGGAFGGKEDYPSVIAGYAAILSYKARRPIKIIYDRNEDIIVSTKRHPAKAHYKTGVLSDGTIKAMEIRFFLDGGAYMSLSPVVLSRGVLHSGGAYKIENFSAHALTFATNTSPNGAFRGFGAPQSIFALESHIDEIANELKMSPLEFRRKNLLKLNDETTTGQRLKESVSASEVLEKASSMSEFEKKSKPDSKWKRNSSKRRGIGISLFLHGAGFTGSGEDRLKSKAGVRLEKDGSVTILTASTEMGQGSHTVLTQIVADALAISIENIKVATPDTSVVPNSGPTVASRTTMVIGKVLYDAALELRNRIESFAPVKKGFIEIAREFYDSNGPTEVIRQYQVPPGIVWDEHNYKGDAYPVFAWGANIAEVEVDMNTFEVKLTNLHLVQDVGKVVNPMLASGQVEGGALQAVGYALLENFVMDKGHVKTDRMQTYLIPTALDAPKMHVHFIENLYSYSAGGCKGLGELPMDGPAPAIANAVYDAIGVRIRDLPITPEKLLAACIK
ncbi:MAG: xanthine dehydrogenase family protein molybdopterin-binding subunit [Pseudomonadota bacterium]